MKTTKATTVSLRTNRKNRKARTLSRHNILATSASALLALFTMPDAAQAVTNTFSLPGFTQTQTVGGPVPATVWTFGGVNWTTGATTTPSTSELVSSVFTFNAATGGGPAAVTFNHAFTFENGFDGGRLEMSVNGGAFALVGASAFTQNAYNNTAGGTNPLVGSPVFGGGAAVAQTSTANLGSFAVGDTVQLRWRGSWDGSITAGSPNWQLNSAAVLTPDATNFWKGGASNTWTGANWTTDAAGTTQAAVGPGTITDVTFSATGAANQVTTLGTNFNIHSLTIADSANVGINGSTLTVSGASGTTGITINAGAGFTTINSNVTLAGASNTITTNNSLNAINGVVSGSVGLVKNGTGLLGLGNAGNNYTGGTTINGGTLSITNGTALSTGSVTVNNGGTLLGAANLSFAGNAINLTNGSNVSAAAGTVLNLGSGVTGSLTMLNGSNVTFGSAGNTGVVTIGNISSSTVGFTSTITVAFGTLRNAGGVINLGNFTINNASTTVNAGATLDVNDFSMTVKQLLGAGAVTLGANAATTLTLNSGNFSGAISGAGNVTVTGNNGDTTLSSANSSYTGVTSVTGGVLNVSTLANGGANSSIGASTNAAANLVITGGILKYNGTGASTDRLFTIGTGANAAAIDSSGTGALNFTNTGPIAFSGAGNRTLTLTGNFAGVNLMAAQINDGPGGITTVNTSAGTTQWLLTNNLNSFSGLTTVVAGQTLLVGANGALGAGGSAASGTVVNAGGTLQLQNGVNVANEFLTLNGSGVNNAGALTVQPGPGNSATFGGPITVATDSVITAGNGNVLTLTGLVNKTGVNLTLGNVAPGATTATSGRIVIAGAGITGGAAGTFISDMVITAGTTDYNVANSYSGATWVTNGGILNLNAVGALPAATTDPTPNPSVTGVRTALILDADTAGNFPTAPAGARGGTGSSVVNVNSNQFIQYLASGPTSPGTSSVKIATGATLTIGTTAATLGAVTPATFTGVISGNGNLFKDGTSTQILTGANTYFGQTRINGGILQIGDGISTVASISNSVPVVVDIAGELAVNLTNGNNFTNDVTDNGLVHSLVTAGVTQTFTGSITSSGKFLADKGGTTILAGGANGYQGGTTVSGNSTLQIGTAGGSPAASTAGQNISTNVITLGGAGTFGNLVVVNAVGGILANNITGGAGGTLSTVSDTGSATTVKLTGAITDGGGAVQVFANSATGTLILANANNTYTGTGSAPAFGSQAFGGGTLQIGTATEIGSVGASAIDADTGGTVVLVNIGTAANNTLNNNISNGFFGTGTFNVFSAQNNTLAGVLSDGGAAAVLNLVQSGTGTTYLTNANTYVGTTTITGGTLQVGGQAAGGTATGTLGNGGAVSIAQNTNLNFNRSNALAVANAISGAGNVNQIGTGTTTVSGANTYTGATTVQAGVLQLGSTGALGSAALFTSGVTVSNGAALDLAGFSPTAAAALNLNGAGIAATGALTNSGAAATYSGVVTLQSSSSIGGAGNITLNNTVTGGSAAQFTKVGVDTVFLTGGNNYAGATVVAAGILNAGTNTALGIADGTASTGTTVNAGATLQLAGGVTINNELLNITGTGVGGIGAVNVLAGGPVTYTGAATLGGAPGTVTSVVVNAGAAATFTGGFNKNARTLLFNVGAGGTMTISGVGISGATSFTSDMTYTGAGTTTLLVASNYAGPTWISNGATVNANVLGALPATAADGSGTPAAVRTTVIMDPTAAQVTAGSGLPVATSVAASTLNLGANQFIQALIGSNPNANSTVNLNANTLTIGTNAVVAPTTSPATFAGLITGTGGITKDGTNVQIFAGQNTYTGATLVSGGTLAAGVNDAGGQGATTNGAFGNSSAVTVNTPGVLEIGGFNVGIGSLSGTGTVQDSSGGFGTLTTGGNNLAANFSGVLQDQAAGGALGGLQLWKSGTATQTLSGAAANTYTGVTFVFSGELDLNKTAGVDAIGIGNLFIGDGAGPGGANSDIVKLLASNQINNGTSVFIDGTTGKLDLNNFNETILVLSDSGNPITTNGSSVALGSGTLTFGDGTNNTFSGAITGTGNIIKNGTGTETFAGTTTANTYSGLTTVNAGMLQLNKNANVLAVGGNLTIGDGVGGGARTDIVQLLAANQIISTSLVLIDGTTGQLDLNGNNQTLGSIADTGVVTPGGSLINLGAGILTTNAGGGANPLNPSTTFSGAITGAGGQLVKEGTGTLTLAGAPASTNTYTGLTTVNAGELDLNKTGGGIAVSGNLTIGNGAGPNVVPTAQSDIVKLLGNNQIVATSLVLINGTTGKLDLNGNTQTVGSIADTGVVTGNGSNINLGAGTLTTNAGGGANPANPSTTFSGSITGAGGNLTKEGTGILTLAGAAVSTNTYSGLTTVNAGELDLNKSGGALAVGGNLTIGNGAGGGANSDIVKLLQSNQIISTSVVQINATSGKLDLNNQSQTVGSIASIGVFTLGGSTITLGTGALTTGNAANTAYSGVISGSGTLTKQGTGTFTLSGANTYSGPTTVNAGTLSLSGGAALADTSAVTVAGPGTLNLVNSETIASLAGSGAVTLNAQTLTTGGDNTSTTFSGVISGAGGALVKNGTGFFTVSGANTYTGGTTQNAGTLGAANGSAFGNGNLTMNGGTIQTVGGPLIVNIGAGNVVFNGGTYIANVGGTTPGVQHDQLLTTGTAAFPGGTLALVQQNGYKLAPGDKVNLAIATGGVAGGTALGAALPAAAVTGLAAFSNTPLLVATVNLYTTSVTLEAMQGSFLGLNGQTFGGIKVAYTPNQMATAAALDSVAKKINFKTGIFKELNFLDTQSLSTLPGNLDKLAPEEYQAIFTTSYSTANILAGNLMRRMDDVRTNATVPSMPSAARGGNNTVYADGAHGPVGRRSKEIAPPRDDARWGMFLSGSGEFTRVGSTTNAAGYKLETGGVTAGLDYRVNTNFVVGLDLGYVGTSARLANGGKLDNDGGRLGIYATYFDENFHVDMAVNGGLNSYKTRRTTPNNTSATGSPDGSEINVLIAAGYDWKFGGLTLGPTASFQYTNVHMDGFNETGPFAPLSVSSQSGESSRTALGIRAYYDAHVGRIIVRPEVRASWQHEFGDTSTQITSRFSSLGSNAFTVTGPVTGRDSLLLGAGFSILWNDRMSTYVYYDGELGRSNYDSHNVSGGFRYQW